jgi:tryptophan-rich sensory protein
MKRFAFVRLLLPLVIGHFLINKWCSSAPQSQPRMMNDARAVIWPALLLSIGIAWEMVSVKNSSLRADLVFTSLITLICWWFQQWCSGNDVTSNMIMAGIIAATVLVTLMSAKANPKAGLFLLPLMAWLLIMERPFVQLSLPSLPKLSELKLFSKK